MRSQTKIFSLFIILLFVSSLAAQRNDSIYTLPIGTKIRARMDNEISSKVSSVNDTFTVTVSKPVIVREMEILPVGTVFEGRITQVKRASFGGKNGTFEVQFESLRLPNGAKREIKAGLIDLEAPQNTSSARKSFSILGGTAAGALIGGISGKRTGALIGAGIGAGAGTSVAVWQKGKDARIKSNEEIEIRLNKEVTLPVEDF